MFTCPTCINTNLSVPIKRITIHLHVYSITVHFKFAPPPTHLFLSLEEAHDNKTGGGGGGGKGIFFKKKGDLKKKI